MATKNKTSFRFRFSEFLLIGLILLSSFLLAFSSGKFVLNFKQIGFSVLSTFEKGVHTVVDGVSNTVNAVSELKKLKKD